MRSSHLTTWCGFSIDSKRHSAYINFIKYAGFRSVIRYVKEDRRPFVSIQLSIQHVLRSRLRAARRAQSPSSVGSQYYLVFCSALFAVKRALWTRRVMNGRCLERLVRWCRKYIGQNTVVDAQRVRWLVEYAFFLLMRNCEVYNKVRARWRDEE